MDDSERNQALFARAVYVLYLVSLIPILFGVTAIVGVVIAHLHHERADPLWQEHFRFQYRTFWIGVLYWLISMILSPVGVGVVLLLLTFLWFVVRTVRGLIAAMNNEEIDRPDTWFV